MDASARHRSTHYKMLVHLMGHLQGKRIILASQSPRRAEILRMLGLDFEIMPSSFEENLPKASFDSARAYCAATAHGKAAAVAQTLDSRGEAFDLVLGSDTIVVLGGKILEKPKSEGEAVRMLTSLSGQRHTVITAVTLVAAAGSHGESGGGRHVMRDFACETGVQFATLTPEVVQAYVRIGEGDDKAGAYGIQGVGGSLVSSIDGCYFTVMGLPLHETSRQIARLIDDDLL